MQSPAPYRLDQLGWLQFERLCTLVLELSEGAPKLAWHGRADDARAAWIEEPLELAGHARIPAPALVAVVWVPERPLLRERLTELATRVSALAAGQGARTPGRIVVLTNLDGDRARRTLVALDVVAGARRVAVVGAAELGALLDRDPRVRAALPSVLGLRDLDPLIPAQLRARSRFDLDAAQALARVFSPTRAFERARLVLERHGFVVLTGPPEMGKTAIARMIALAALTDGWEAHECDSPEEVWRAFDAERHQCFIADDAFGSTEYRPDAAERWARELAGLLGVLDQGHRLIWTSRPAPLKAALRRLQRERGSERFPAPAEVLVDAGELSLEEKTLILFRHAKDHELADASRALLRSAGLQIVEHPHFTPERIRRFAAGRLATLPALVGADRAELLGVLARELASPTRAMRASFAALEREHRDLLIALLDAPAGLIDERELASTVRRHHPGGLSRSPGVLIDRLTDHFLRVTSLGVGWVHPSWRDLVIDELRAHDEERLHFLRSCGVHGAMLALSHEGGVSGERALPLLIDDADWDALADRIAVLLRELDDHDVAWLLVTLRRAMRAHVPPPARAEEQSLAAYVLNATRRAWDARRAPLPLAVLEAWYALRERVPGVAAAPQVEPTWSALYPDPALLARERAELARADEWLALAQLLARHDPSALARLGFPGRDVRSLRPLMAAAAELAGTGEEGERDLARSIIARICEVAPDNTGPVPLSWLAGERSTTWWVPEDIAGPPSTEPAAAAAGGFRREDVARVLSDL